MQSPRCKVCGEGDLVPLSDYGGGSSPASIHYKAWVCSTPSCGFHIRIDNGEILVQTGDKPHWRSTKRGRGGGGGGGGGR